MENYQALQVELTEARRICVEQGAVWQRISVLVHTMRTQLMEEEADLVDLENAVRGVLADERQRQREALHHQRRMALHQQRRIRARQQTLRMRRERRFLGPDRPSIDQRINEINESGRLPQPVEVHFE